MTVCIQSRSSHIRMQARSVLMTGTSRYASSIKADVIAGK
jgi:hypothetical protein